MHYTRAAPPLFSPYRTKARAIRVHRLRCCVALSRYRPPTRGALACRSDWRRRASRDKNKRVPGTRRSGVRHSVRSAPSEPALHLPSDLEGSQSHERSRRIVSSSFSTKPRSNIFTHFSEIIPTVHHVNGAPISDDSLTCPFDLSSTASTCSRSREETGREYARTHYLFRCSVS